MKTKHCLLIVLLGLSVLAFAQENDDMYFNSKDRVQVAEENSILTSEPDSDVKATNDNFKNKISVSPSKTYSGRGVNPEYNSQSINGTAILQERPSYFVTNYQPQSVNSTLYDGKIKPVSKVSSSNYYQGDPYYGGSYYNNNPYYSSYSPYYQPYSPYYSSNSFYNPYYSYPFGYSTPNSLYYSPYSSYGNCCNSNSYISPVASATTYYYVANNSTSSQISVQSSSSSNVKSNVYYDQNVNYVRQSREQMSRGSSNNFNSQSNFNNQNWDNSSNANYPSYQNFSRMGNSNTNFGGGGSNNGASAPAPSRTRGRN